MRATLRMKCSIHGELGTMVISAAPDVVDRVETETREAYYKHGLNTCGGELSVSRYDHHQRVKKGDE